MEKQKTMTFYIIDLLLVFAALFLEGGKKSFSNKKNFFETTEKLGFKKKIFLKKTVFDSIILLALLIIASTLLSQLFFITGLNDLEKIQPKIEFIEKNKFFAAYLLIVRVIAEETFFRGFLARKTNALLSAIVFGLVHTGYNSISETIGATILGYLLALYFLQKKSIYPNILAHSTYNFIALFW